jgi:hypothetical protein
VMRWRPTKLPANTGSAYSNIPVARHCDRALVVKCIIFDMRLCVKAVTYFVLAVIH